MSELSLKEKLENEWLDEKEILKEMDLENPKYQLQLERVTNLEKSMVDLEKAELDVDKIAGGQALEADVKYKQIKCDEQARKTKTKIDILGIVLPLASAIGMGLFTMKWENYANQTTTAGKASFRDIIRFKR